MNPSDSRGVSTPAIVDWRTRASCLGRDPEAWFPRGTTGPFVVMAEGAKRICRACPVAITCVTMARKTGATDGIFGGLDPDQRRTVARRAAKSGLTFAASVRAEWARDVRRPLVDTYLSRTVQGDDGHVWWRGQKTSYSIAGRVLTPKQLGFEVGRERAPDGHVKAACGQPFCVASEHLTDGIDRWHRDHPTAA
ncbi:WhiB family transcriptional regulator [Streptomyces sp. NPDC094049]|uniref:WhiB family transcriptional regulator n=1 Tax=Streptomyces sp. NPDC094049 TaxID=3154987 RepID=UPI003326D7FA